DINGDYKAHSQQQDSFPEVPQPAHLNINVNQQSIESSPPTFNEKESKEYEKAIRKQFPYRNPSPLIRKICIVVTVFQFFTLLTTISVLELYSNATFTAHVLPRNLFYIIVACECLPRIIQTYQLYIYTKKQLTRKEVIGTLLCQIAYYYWKVYIYNLQSEKLQHSSSTGKMVAKDLNNAIKNLLLALIIA
ncbi:18884_t:CDS:2, partial [Racocetra persica]